jgi:hypothetical protein
MLEFHCPFPKRIHPSAARSQIASLRWMQGHGLLDRAIDRSRFERSHSAIRTALMFPEASDDVLQLAADWTGWLFSVGGYCDESGIARSPLKMRAFGDRLAATLFGQVAAGDAITAALSDLCRRFAALGGQVPFSRFAAHTVDYFEARAWEAENRAARVAPRLAVFEIMRSCAGAAWTFLDLAEIAAGAILPVAVRQHHSIQRANQAVCRIACLNEDALAFAREPASDDTHNLVRVLMGECGMSVPQAVRALVESCDSEVRVLERIVNTLPSFGCETADDAAWAYTRALAGLVRGAIDWTTGTAVWRESNAAA